ncbi:MAG: prevent-host-death protein [Pseudomonadota bacterium]
MPISAKDISPFSQVRARLTDLGEEASAGEEKIIYYHQLEREHIHLMLLDEAASGWEDVEAGRHISVAKLRDKHGRG